SAPVELSSVADRGAVEGARPVVGPNGELYAVWSAIGTGPEDYLRLRASLDHGATWNAETTPVARYLDFATGAPGSNRERGVDLPAIAADRTFGRNRGRIHLAWTESANPYDDALDRLGSSVTCEGAGWFASAAAFTPGQRLRGTLGASGDRDYFAFTAVQ